MSRLSSFATGAVMGIAVTALAVWVLMPKLMINVHDSRLGFDETVTTLQESIKAKGWQLPKVYDIQASLQKAGYSDMIKVKIMSLCQPHHAYQVLKNDEDKVVTAIMPCRISVYERQDGSVAVAGMNVGLLSQMFGGNIAKVMGGVAAEEQEMLDQVIRE